MSTEIKINPQYQELLHPLSDTEKKLLEESLLDEGCRNPLISWNGYIIDGHNRYDICKRHSIEFAVIEKEFDKEVDAKDWIDRNQLARRNLTPDAFRLTLGRRYNRMKKAAHGRSDRDFSGAQSEHPKKKTADKLAEEHGVSRETVKRAGKFAEEVGANPKLQEAIKEKKPIKKVKKEQKKKERKRKIKALDLSKLEKKKPTVHLTDRDREFSRMESEKGRWKERALNAEKSLKKALNLISEAAPLTWLHAEIAEVYLDSATRWEKEAEIILNK